MKTTDILDQIDTALDDWEVGPDAMRCNAPAGAAPWSAPTTPLTGVMTVAIAADVSRIVAAFERASRSIAHAMAINEGHSMRMLSDLAAAFAWPARDEHHPPPLCIDGHAYHRRTRNRRKRR